MLSLPDRALYSIPAPWKYIFWAGQAAAAVLLLVGVLETDGFHFAGLRQVFNQPNAEASPSKLVKSGLYRFVRHPLYTAGLLFMWLTTNVSMNTFIVFIGLTVYILIGAWFEERKLVREFGEEYIKYRRKTPMLIPGLGVKSHEK
jgi:protein-S-isoprenylcysteine O-methyltransferase Ste14